MLSYISYKHNILIEELSKIDDLKAWSSYVPNVEKEVKKYIYESAE